MRIRTLLLALLLLLLSLSVQANEARLRCIADTNLSSYESERDFNYGQSSRLRLKGIQMLALFRFDTAPVAGWQVRKATLSLRYAGAERKLRALGISTISAPWQEGTGTGEPKAGETCFSWRAYKQARWAGEETDFTDVSFTAGQTRARYADIKPLDKDWFAVSIAPELAQALIAGASYGLAVTDEKGQTSANNDIFSREQSGSEPYLVIEGEPGPNAAPPAATGLMLRPDSRHADFEAGAMLLTLTAPRNAFAYDVQVGLQDGALQPFPRSAIPFAQSGQRQTIRLEGLKPDASYRVEIVSISATGVHGAPVRITGMASAAKSKPAALRLAPSAPRRPQTPPLHDSRLRLWAYPDTEKADPVSGDLLEAKAGVGDYRNTNEVWDGQGVSLHGARNEFIGFQLLIEATTGSLRRVTVSSLPAFESGNVNAAWQPNAHLFRDWYVRDGAWFPEICVPLTKPFDIPAADNAVPNQRNQSVFVEFLIPRTVPAGRYRSVLTVAAEGVTPVRVPLTLTVNPLTLPDTLSFEVSLNTYGTLGGPFDLNDRTAEYRRLEREYHRMAHEHRATLAILGYSHSGNVSTNYAPPLAGEGAAMRVRDWSLWDQQFGPYLDGSAFADLPRKGVPLTHFYLPFHEAWPGDIRAHYHYQPTTTAYPANITEHALHAPPIEQAFDKEYADSFIAVAKQFAAHFREKGWTRTQFQFYQNDKNYYKDPKMGGRGTSWWLLDEPNFRDDWLALAYFARLFHAGVQGMPGISMPFREDISRPQWQRDYLDGLVDVMVVSGELYAKGPLLRDVQERWGVRYWNYGAANAIRRSNVEAEGWAVRAWLAGADGIVPWQSVGTDENYTRAEETALLLPGKRFGIAGPVASLRLKALRRAQQDAEYLVLAAAARHWDRAQMGAALRTLLPNKGTFAQSHAEDAGSYRFEGLRAADFAAMRRALAEERRERP